MGPAASLIVSEQVWAIPTKEMQCEWLGERVATVDVERAIHNIINNKEDAGWGPNAVFRFPTRGGTGASWKGVAALLPQDKQVRQPLDWAKEQGQTWQVDQCYLSLLCSAPA